MYVGCLLKKVGQVLDICRTELATVGDTGTARRNSRVARGHVGLLVLGLEDTGSRMSRLGKSGNPGVRRAHVRGRNPDHIDAVTGEDVRAVARDVVANSVSSLAVIGPFAHDEFVDAVA